MIIEFPRWVVGVFAIGFHFHYTFGPILSDILASKTLSFSLFCILYIMQFHSIDSCILSSLYAQHTRESKIRMILKPKITATNVKISLLKLYVQWEIVASSGGQHPLPFNSNRMNFHYKLKFDKMESFCIVLCCLCIYVCWTDCVFLSKHQNN